MRSLALLLVVALTACAADDAPVDAPSSGIDAPTADASGDAVALDGSVGNGVLCASADQSCREPTQHCCDVATGTDTCIGTNDSCAGDVLECDGPEDCFTGQECCLFEGQGSRCIDEGICGTTGTVSNEMCHVEADCDADENCCGTAPGPALDLYSKCQMGPCPQ